MLSEKAIRSIKELIENPNVERAMRMIPFEETGDLNVFMCDVAGEGHRPCEKCVWKSICQFPRSADKITDEILSEMVLDAMRMLAIDEAENA